VDGCLRPRPRSGPGRAGGRGVCGRGPVDGRLDGGRILPEQPGSHPRGGYDRHHGRLRPTGDRSRLPRGPRKRGRDPVPVARGPGTSSGTRPEGVQGTTRACAALRDGGPAEPPAQRRRRCRPPADYRKPPPPAGERAHYLREEDLVCPPETIEATAEELPESVVRCMARSGHSVYF